MKSSIKFGSLSALKNIVAFIVCALVVFASIWFWHLRVNTAASAVSEVSMATTGDDESYASKLARYRAGAESAARAACTNEVTGLRGIISLDVQTSDDNFMNWTASATVEYINQIGGVDRTNLDFKFNPGYTGQPTWFPSS